MKEDEIIFVYIKKEEIEKIISRLKRYSFNQLIKRGHYYDSLYEKNTNEEFIKDTYIKFKNIELIFYRKRKDGRFNYDLFYRNDDDTYTVFCIIIDDPPVLINAFPVDRKFDNYLEHIKHKYPDKIV